MTCQDVQNVAFGSGINQYKVIFSKTCPVNNSIIKYTLKIKTKNVVLVEDLISFIKNLEPAFHEIIADKLAEKFGGKQTLIANHHGVTITTERATW